MTEENRMRLALATGFSLRTVAKWVKGKTVNKSTAEALQKASEKLGIDRVGDPNG